MALELVLEMQNRVSTKSVDKVAGLAHLLYPDSIPIYDEEMSDADAWEVLMDAICHLGLGRSFSSISLNLGRETNAGDRHGNK